MRCSSHWLETLPENDSIDILRDLATSHAMEAGPWRDVIVSAIRSQNFRLLCELEIDYSLEGATAHCVMHARQALAFFSKLRRLDIGVDRESVGMSKFLEAERLCKESNDRFLARRNGTLGFPARVERAFLLARRKISRVLGDVPSLDQLTLRFGPGSTRKTRKADASIRRKCAEGITCSEELFPVVKQLLRELPHLSSENAVLSRIDEDGEEWDTIPIEIETSALCFVFKNALTYRLIGVEALLNLVYQLGYGVHMAKRLAAFGVDIRRQEPNQLLARKGSLTGALATLDLSSASDTVSREIVYELLPVDWAHVLARGKSAKILLPNGQTVIQQKFSAMGNGFTFPLETLIFWALATSVCDRVSDVCVYGDDIICPSDRFDDVVEVLTYAGFNVNKKKSFKTGPFRESCGKDYFEGIDVRPFYQKEWISGQTLFVLHNWYVRHGDDVRAKEVMKFIHPALHLYGPDGYGDGHLIGDHPRRRTAAQQRKGYGGYFFETFSTRSRKEDNSKLQDPKKGVFPAALYSIYMRGETSPGFPTKAALDDDASFYEVLTTPLLNEVIDREIVSPVTPVSVDPQGSKTWQLPGFDGYKKIKIYNFGT